MKRFRASPIIIEAYQFLGDIQVFPVEWHSSIMQPYVGQRCYLPSSLNNNGYVDGEMRYSTHDKVEVGDWVFHDGIMLRRMGPGEFDRRFSEIRERVETPDDAKWIGIYIGANDGSTPAQTSWLGYPWRVGEPVPMANEAHARLVGANAHFIVTDLDGVRFPPIEAPVVTPEELGETLDIEEVTDATDDSSAWSESAAEAGRGDRGGSLGAGGRDHLDAAAIGGEGDARDRHSSPAGEFPPTPAKRGPGRPRREDYAGVRP